VLHSSFIKPLHAPVSKGIEMVFTSKGEGQSSFEIFWRSIRFMHCGCYDDASELTVDNLPFLPRRS
jgi:hypothetical protein